jgi:hypothetical protein
VRCGSAHNTFRYAVLLGRLPSTRASATPAAFRLSGAHREDAGATAPTRELRRSPTALPPTHRIRHPSEGRSRLLSVDRPNPSLNVVWVLRYVIRPGSTVPCGAMESEPWQFGWEALVALGTVGLAGATAYLAAKTRDLANESVTDRASQWRPAIVPASEYLTRPSVDANDERLRIRLRNAGRGPARYLLVGLALGHDPHPEESIEPAELWASAVMAPSDEVELEFRVKGRPEVCRVLVDYRDLANRRYASRLNIDRVSRSDAVQQYDLLRISNVILYEDKRLTPWDEPTFA